MERFQKSPRLKYRNVIHYLAGIQGSIYEKGYAVYVSNQVQNPAAKFWANVYL